MTSLREMREHVGVDPEAIASGKVWANRADRRLADRVMREQQNKLNDTAEIDREGDIP